MKPQQMPTWLTRTLLLGLGAVFVLMPVHAFVSTWGGTAIGPLWFWKSWKELLLAGLTIVTVGWFCFHPSVIRSFAKKPLTIAIVAYLLLTIVLTVFYRQSNGTDATMAGLAMNLRYLGFAALAYLLFCYGDTSTVWFKRACWFLIGAGLIVSALAIVQIYVLPSDFLVHFGYDKTTTIAPRVLIDDNPNLPRAFATLRGPNDFGAFLILPLILVLSRIRRMSLWMSVSSLALLSYALLLSGSRSAWLGALIAVGVYGFLRLRTHITPKKLGLVLVGVVVLLGATVFAAATIAPLRAAIFHSSPTDSSLTEGSTDNHLSATLHGVDRVIANPFGCGPGCAGPASYYGESPKISENYFVQIAEETGLMGLGLFLTIVCLVGYKLYKNTAERSTAHALLASLIGYICIGLLLHVWSDDPLSIMWWMFAGAMIGYNESQRWITSKNNSRSKRSSSL